MKSEAEKEAGAGILKQYSIFFKKQHQEYSAFSDDLLLYGNNRSFLPIKITSEPKEIISVIDLVSSDNILLTKILGVLSSMCAEVVNLKKEAFERYIIFFFC